MNRRKRTLVFASAVVMVIAVSGLILADYSFEKKDRISGERAMEYVRKLAGDEFNGRKGGLPGSLEASRWIAERFEEWGLEPAGTDGYFQEFTHPVFHVKSASLAIDNGARKRTFEYDEEWQIQNYSGSGSVRGELVFVGYGITARKQGWDDYAQVSVADKVLLMIPYGMPRSLAGKIGLEMTLETKLKRAYEKGARAVIFVNPPADRLAGMQYSFPASAMADRNIYKEDLILGGINNDVSNFIFGTVLENVSYLAKKIDKEGKPQSMELAATAEIAAETIFLPQAKLRNVLAKIPGTDNNLKDQVIISGGHMDHLGYLPGGDVYNGANDNASGTAVVMEAARVFKETGFRPKRTLVFALWDGEEQGILGSRHYCRNPIYPLDKTAAYYNFDCVGKGGPRIYFRGIYFWPELWKVLEAGFSKEIRQAIQPTPGSTVGSDHVPFYESGVPGFAQVVPGEPRTGHMTKDDAEFIDPELLAVNTRLLIECLKLTHGESNLIHFSTAKELYALRSSTLVNFIPSPLEGIPEKIRSAEYVHRDIQFVSIEGETLAEMLAFLESLQKLAGKDNKIELFPSKFDHRSMMDFQFGRYDRKLAVIPGISSLESLPAGVPSATAVKLLARMGARYLMLDDSAAQSAEIEGIIRTCNSEKILLILSSTSAESTKKIIDLSRYPGLLIAKDLDLHSAALLGRKQWRAALVREERQSVESYLTEFKLLLKTSLGGNGLLIAVDMPLAGAFPEELIPLVSGVRKEFKDWRPFRGVMGDNFLILAATIYR